MFKENEKVINLDIGLSTVVSVNKNTCILENNLGETITIEDDSKTRKLIDRKDAFSLLDRVKSLSDEWIKTPRLRYEKYQRDLYSRELDKLFIIIKRMYIEDKYSYGKGLSQTSQELLDTAKRYLYEELAIVFGVNEDEVEKIIVERIGENNGI